MKQNENNDKWLAEIKDKMLDFQAEVPANGWERVSSALPNSNGTRRLGYWPFSRLAHWGVAAVLLCLIIGGYLISKEEQSQIEDGCRAKISEPQSDTQQSSNYAIPTTADNITIQTTEQPNAVLPNANQNPTTQPIVTQNRNWQPNAAQNRGRQPNAAQKSSPYSHSQQADTLKLLASADSLGTIQEELSAVDTQTPIVAANESEPKAAQNLDQQQIAAQNHGRRPIGEAKSSYIISSLAQKTNGSHWSMGLNIGGHGSLLAFEPSGDFMDSGPMNDPNHGTGSSTNMGYLGEDRIVESSNHTSWSIGLSVDKEILPHTYVETGVVYTQLSSDVRYEHRGEVEQKIHYLGVPLRVNHIFLAPKQYQLYVGGGVMLEHSLYATREGKRFDVEPWQLSSNVSVGGQYKISKNLLLYLEPGFSWYFNANKDIPTLRTESPLYFNIRGGVRWLPH